MKVLHSSRTGNCCTSVDTPLAITATQTLNRQLLRSDRRREEPTSGIRTQQSRPKHSDPRGYSFCSNEANKVRRWWKTPTQPITKICFLILLLTKPLPNTDPPSPRRPKKEYLPPTSLHYLSSTLTFPPHTQHIAKPLPAAPVSTSPNSLCNRHALSSSVIQIRVAFRAAGPQRDRSLAWAEMFRRPGG